MKKDYTQEYVIGGVILAGVVGGFYLYRRAKNKKASAEAEAERKRLAAEQAEAVKKNVKTTPAYTPYQLQVIALQTRLGVGIDGNPGTSAASQTNKKVAEFFPRLFAQQGIVSPANVALYLRAQRETTAGASGPKTEPKKPAAVTPGRVDQIWNAMGDGKPAVLRKDGTFPAMYLDRSQGKYLGTGGAFTVKANTRFFKSTSVKAPQGLIATTTVYDAAGKKLPNRLVLITPENLYVP